jgi:hypothetical protein
MSVETLKQDLQQVMEAIPAGTLATSEGLSSYLRNNLVPFIATVVDEVGEQDDCIEALVHQAEDILHTDNGAVFLGLITSGRVLITELRARVGNDKRLLALCREWEALAKEGAQILDDIVVPDEDDDEDVDPDPEDPATPVATETEKATPS